MLGFHSVGGRNPANQLRLVVYSIIYIPEEVLEKDSGQTFKLADFLGDAGSGASRVLC